MQMIAEWLRRNGSRVVGAVLAVTLVSMLAACGGDGEGSDEDGGAVALSLGGADVPVWNTIIELMRPDIEDAGYEFLTHDPQWDVAKQSADWDAWIARGDLKAIMGFPIQVDALAPVSKRIVAADVPLLGYGQKWDETEAAFLTDGYQDGHDLGADTGAWIESEYGKDADIDVVTFISRDDDLSASRADGYADGLKSVVPDVNVREVAALTRQDGYDGTQSALTANPDIRVWIGAEGATLGAFKALAEHGVAPDDPRYFIGSLDLTNESLDLLKKPDSIYRSGFMIPPADVADTLTEMLLAAAKGEDVEDHVLRVQQVTPETADDFYVD